MPVSLLLSGLATAGAAQELPADLLLLSRFKQKIRQDLAQVPNYTCLETIERSQRAAGAASFTPEDTVRVEVSNVNGKELFAWPGARGFDDRGLASMVTSGTIANGMFALSAQEVFVSDNGTFQYRGEQDLAGRRVARYDYRIPQLVSGFTITSHGASARVASVGSAWFDPASLDLIRLDRHAQDLPEELGVTEVVVAIDYGRARIGESNALLARRAELVMTRFSGSTERHAVEFSQCRAYGAESTISFDTTAEPGPEPFKPREVVLPAGLLVPVVLDTPIDSRRASVGDPVRASVREEVRKDGAPVLPAGAVITGHIRRLDRHGAPEPFFALGIELSEADWGTARAQFHAELLDSRGKKDLHPEDAPGVGILYMRGLHFQIEPGFRMLWRTIAAP